MKNYVLNGKETLHLPKEATHPVIREFLQNFTKGVSWETVFDAEDNTLYFGNPTKIDNKGEDYALKVTSDGAFVVGSTFAGLMRGFTTLLERIVCTDFEEYTVEGGEETGSPKIAFRSAHICVFPETKLDFLRKAVRMCVMGKYSHLIIEFWGTLKMDCFELFGWKDAYTKAVREMSQKKLDECGIGITLSHLELTRVGMPEEVRDIYELVNSTNIQASTRIEQARQYYETRIPGAEAEANSLIAEARANYSNYTAAANSDLYEFYGVLEEYNANPDVVRVRLYNTAITNISRKIGTIKIVDDSDSKIIIN